MSSFTLEDMLKITSARRSQAISERKAVFEALGCPPDDSRITENSIIFLPIELKTKIGSTCPAFVRFSCLVEPGKAFIMQDPSIKGTTGYVPK